MTEPYSADRNGVPRFLVYRTRAFLYRVVPIATAPLGDLQRWSLQHVGRDMTECEGIGEARAAAMEWCAARDPETSALTALSSGVPSIA